MDRVEWKDIRHLVLIVYGTRRVVLRMGLAYRMRRALQFCTALEVNTEDDN
jgi:hypothetical protein